MHLEHSTHQGQEVNMTTSQFFFWLTASFAVPGRLYPLFCQAFDQSPTQIGAILGVTDAGRINRDALLQSRCGSGASSGVQCHRCFTGYDNGLPASNPIKSIAWVCFATDSFPLALPGIGSGRLFQWADYAHCQRDRFHATARVAWS